MNNWVHVYKMYVLNNQFLMNRSLKSFAFGDPHNLRNTAMLFFSILNIALFLSRSLKQHLGEKASLLSYWIVSNWMWLLATIYRILLHFTDWIAIISEHQTSKGNNYLSGGRFGCIYIYYHVDIIETFDCAFAVKIKWHLRPLSFFCFVLCCFHHDNSGGH